MEICKGRRKRGDFFGESIIIAKDTKINQEYGFSEDDFLVHHFSYRMCVSRTVQGRPRLRSSNCNLHRPARIKNRYFALRESAIALRGRLHSATLMMHANGVVRTIVAISSQFVLTAFVFAANITKLIPKHLPPFTIKDQK
ncbi:hypothetical protein ABFS82_12G087000 [Erythranthe guttata]